MHEIVNIVNKLVTGDFVIIILLIKKNGQKQWGLFKQILQKKENSVVIFRHSLSCKKLVIFYTRKKSQKIMNYIVII